jgi:hypothetical protein
MEIFISAGSGFVGSGLFATKQNVHNVEFVCCSNMRAWLSVAIARSASPGASRHWHTHTRQRLRLTPLPDVVPVPNVEKKGVQQC